MTVRVTVLMGFAALLTLVGAAMLRAQTPSFVATPLTEMGLPQNYLGFTGGLYPDGSNTMPADHAAAGASRAAQIQPLDTAGNPSPDGSRLLQGRATNRIVVSRLAAWRASGLADDTAGPRDLEAGNTHALATPVTGSVR